jgi:hypothetical protein
VLRRAVLAVALALLAPGTATAAVTYSLQRPMASLRSAPASFAIGTAFAGDRVDVVARSGRWVYGAVGGRCAWMMDRGLRPQGTSQVTCPSPRTLDPGLLFAPRTYQLGCGEGCVYPARTVDCDDRQVYANYDPASGTFADAAGIERVGRGTRGRTLPRYEGVRRGYAGWGVRYVTRDGAATLIKDTGRRRGPTWVFIHSECVQRLSLIVRPARIGAFPAGGRRARAVRSFGRLYERDGCRMTWRKLALTLDFGRGCRRLEAATIGRQPIRGAALVHTWATALGLRVGDRARVLRRLYPDARRRGALVVLEPRLRAIVRRGRVERLRVLGPTAAG